MVVVAVVAMATVGVWGVFLMTSAAPQRSSPTLVDAAEPPGHGLAAQLQRREDVLWQLMHRHAPLGTVLCGTEVLGRSPSGRKAYVWLECGDYLTGRGASEVESGADAAVVTYAGAGRHRHIVRVAIPSPQHRQADLRRMFPTAITDQVNRGEFSVSPDERQRLKAARGL